MIIVIHVCFKSVLRRINNMKIDWGCHRIVFIFNKIVFKFPNPKYCISWFIKGIKGNIQESKLSKTNKAYYPVIFSFPLGIFLIMKKAETLNSDININLDIFMTDNNITTVENKLESFGLFKNQIVCIDYENQ